MSHISNVNFRLTSEHVFFRATVHLNPYEHREFRQFFLGGKEGMSGSNDFGVSFRSGFGDCRYWNWFDLVLGAAGLADLTIQFITRDSALVGSCPADMDAWSDPTTRIHMGAWKHRGYGKGDVIPGP